MGKLDPVRAIRDTLFSGAWEGHYVQSGARYPQAQRMEFADGIARGEGADGIGRFVIEGEYRAVGPREVRIGWIKTYDGAHSVLYLGVYDGRSIRGRWELPGWNGTFEFQPAQRGDPR